MKVLIIGGNRFVGKKLVKTLLKNKNQVTVLNRSGTGPDGATKIKFDRNIKSDILSFNFNKFDCIVDMCLFKPKQFNLIKDEIPTDVNYIFVSSGAVDYIDTKSFGDYAIEKMAIEKSLSQTDLNYKIIRPSYIVGIGNHRPRLGYYINKLKNNEPISIDGDGDYPINLVFANDVVNCLIKLINDNNKTCKTYNICGNESITINQLIDYIKLQIGVKNHTTINSENALFPNQAFEFDNSDIKRDYKLNFINLKKGIKTYMEETNGC